LFTKVLNNKLNLWAENYSVYCEASVKLWGPVDNIFNQVFNENPGYQIGEWRAGGRAAGRAGRRILNGVKLRFPLNNLSFALAY